MPQQSLFGGWPITTLEIKVHLNADGPGGHIWARVLDSNGKQTEAQTVKWMKDRDVSDLGQVLKEVAQAFLWAESGDVSKMLASATRIHLPEVPIQDRV